MSNSNPKQSVKPQQDDPALTAAELALCEKVKLARENLDAEALAAACKKLHLARPDNPRVRLLIAKLAAAVQVGKEAAAELESINPGHGYVIPSHGEEGMKWERFVNEHLLGWGWCFQQVELVLGSYFEVECEAGVYVAGQLDEEELILGKPDDDAEEPDTPHVAE